MSKTYLQERLESGVNIKTINGVSVLGEGDLNVKITDEVVPLLLDGTEAKYKEVMKAWFNSKGLNALTSAGLTSLVDKWYAITRTAWSGGTEFYQPSESSSSAGTKTKSNAEMVCVPSTNTVKGRDDYAGLSLFAVVDCNFEYDSAKRRPIITAIDGITEGFERYNPNKYVGVLQQSAYHYYDEHGTTYEHGICSYVEAGHDYCEPYPEAINFDDNSVREWVCHAKYMNRTVNNKLTSYAGVMPTAWMSENILVDRKNTMANGLCGGSIMDYAFIQLMAFIKYGQMTMDEKIQGCVNYNYQYYAVKGETGVKRVILDKSQAANFIVGSGVLIGAYSGSTDRNNGGVYSITGQAGAIITDIKNEVIDGVERGVVYVDTANTFNTAANGSAATGTTIISSFHWPNGSCDKVLGNDGSPFTPGDGRNAAKIQGIEYSVGGYEVFSDVILSEDTEKYNVYFTNNTDKQSKSSVSDYINAGIVSMKQASAAWRYIKKLGFGKGVFFGTMLDGSSSTYVRDAFYQDAAATTGTREWLAFGSLGPGSGNGGLSGLNGNNGLSFAHWLILARLSCNGNRGEYIA